jgi:mono/diheme cytochrome c family protein
MPRKVTPLTASISTSCSAASPLQDGAWNSPAPIVAHTALPFDGFKGQICDPTNDMPAYSDAVLPDKDIADIFAFVESLTGPRSPKDIPILNN